MIRQIQAQEKQKLKKMIEEKPTNQEKRIKEHVTHVLQKISSQEMKRILEEYGTVKSIKIKKLETGQINTKRFFSQGKQRYMKLSYI